MVKFLLVKLIMWPIDIFYLYYIYILKKLDYPVEEDLNDGKNDFRDKYEEQRPNEDFYFYDQEEYEREYQINLEFNKMYMPLLKSIEESARIYSVVYNSRDYFSSLSEDLIERCRNEYGLAVALDKKYPGKVFTGILQGVIYRWVRVLELRKDYNGALNVCSFMLQQGHLLDGSPGGIEARYERLRHKIIKQNR